MYGSQKRMMSRATLKHTSLIANKTVHPMCHQHPKCQDGSASRNEMTEDKALSNQQWSSQTSRWMAWAISKANLNGHPLPATLRTAVTTDLEQAFAPLERRGVLVLKQGTDFLGAELSASLWVYFKQFSDPKSQPRAELINTILYYTGCITIIESYIIKTGASMLLWDFYLH